MFEVSMSLPLQLLIADLHMCMTIIELRPLKLHVHAGAELLSFYFFDLS